MKIKKPPKRIYLQWYGDESPDELGEADENEVCWSADRVFKHDIVYVRLPQKRRKKSQPAGGGSSAGASRTVPVLGPHAT